MADIFCRVCGVRLVGPALYCYGCFTYCCRGCGVAAGFNEFTCANCAVDVEKVTV